MVKFLTLLNAVKKLFYFLSSIWCTPEYFPSLFPTCLAIISLQITSRLINSSFGWDNINGSVQEKRKSITNVLDLCLSCTNPPIYQRNHFGLKNVMVSLFDQEWYSISSIDCIITVVLCLKFQNDGVLMNKLWAIEILRVSCRKLILKQSSEHSWSFNRICLIDSVTIKLFFMFLYLCHWYCQSL